MRLLRNSDGYDWQLPGCGYLLFVGAWAATLVPALLLALLLLGTGVTLEGKSCAIAVLALWLAPMFLSRAKRVGWMLVAAGIASLAVAAWRVPPGKNPPEAAVRSVYRGNTRFVCWSPSQLVPEVDQHLLGSHLFRWIDPNIDAAKAAEIRRSFLSVYEPMRRDADFHRLGNALGQCYADMFLGRVPTGHSYVYRPKSAAGEHLPVILFLHGSLGNFKGYLWAWKAFADAEGFAIVAPTYGQGAWHQPGGLAAIESGLKICRNEPGIDASRIYLAGISNGAMGVTRALLHDSTPYRGILYLSPVLEENLATTPQFIRACREKPVLVISGQEDRRIPVRMLQPIAEKLAESGIDAEFHFVPGEDHFLFFSQPERVWEKLRPWLERGAFAAIQDEEKP